jgi:hypothetical protein
MSDIGRQAPPDSLGRGAVSSRVDRDADEK